MSFYALLSIIAAFLFTWIVPVIFAVITGAKHKGYITALMCGLLSGVISALIAAKLPFKTSSFGEVFLTAFFTACIYFITRAVMLKLSALHGNGISLGYGVGIGQGVAAMLTGSGLLYINNVVYGMMLYTKSLGGTLERAGLSPEQISGISNTLSGTPPMLYLMSGFEQFINIAFTVLGGFVLAWFIQKKMFFAGCAAGFSLEFAYRLILLLLRQYANETVQYMSITLLVLIVIVMLYLSLVAIERKLLCKV